MREEYLPYSLEGIHLNTPVAVFEHDSEWTEIAGSEKKYVDAGSPLSCPERIFEKACGNKTLYCGFVFGRLYQVGILTSLSDSDLYLEELSKQYGVPDEIQDGYYAWENYDICLQLVRGSDLYIFLQDKRLLLKARQ